eukprot:TRINITY_DN6085_c0_g1_i1.p1 TRINITY_DN6085_c0_g1~~TRINITY_DN6085_c0_g1_i1.p1  ORF type:complete len:837 (-),score=159.49 TRINITY_DN6085_c0_g1_i1:36-2546(-)
MERVLVAAACASDTDEEEVMTIAQLLRLLEALDTSLGSLRSDVKAAVFDNYDVFTASLENDADLQRRLKKVHDRFSDLTSLFDQRDPECGVLRDLLEASRRYERLGAEEKKKSELIAQVRLLKEVHACVKEYDVAFKEGDIAAAADATARWEPSSRELLRLCRTGNETEPPSIVSSLVAECDTRRNAISTALNTAWGRCVGVEKDGIRFRLSVSVSPIATPILLADVVRGLELLGELDTKLKAFAVDVDRGFFTPLLKEVVADGRPVGLSSAPTGTGGVAAARHVRVGTSLVDDDGASNGGTIRFHIDPAPSGGGGERTGGGGSIPLATVKSTLNALPSLFSLLQKHVCGGSVDHLSTVVTHMCRRRHAPSDVTQEEGVLTSLVPFLVATLPASVDDLHEYGSELGALINQFFDDMDRIGLPLATWSACVPPLSAAEDDTDPLRSFVACHQTHFARSWRRRALLRARDVVLNECHKQVRVGNVKSTERLIDAVEKGRLQQSDLIDATGDTAFQFPRCSVSKAAHTIASIVQSAVVASRSCPTPASAVEVVHTAEDVLDLWRAINLTTHVKERDCVPQLGMLYHSDASYLSHIAVRTSLALSTWCRQDASVAPDMQSVASSLLVAAGALTRDAEVAYRAQIDRQLATLLESLDDTGGFANTHHEKRAKTVYNAVRRTVHQLGQLAFVWHTVLTPDAYLHAIGAILSRCAKFLVDGVLSLHDIGEEESHQLYRTLGLLAECEEHFDVVSLYSNEAEGDAGGCGLDEPELRGVINFHTDGWERFLKYQELLELPLMSFGDQVEMGLFQQANVTVPEIRQLIMAIFSDSNLRRGVLAKIR